MRHVLRRLGGALLLTAIIALISGCNTLEGAGKDIESAGESVQDAADGD